MSEPEDIEEPENAPDGHLTYRIHAMLDHMQINGDPEATEDDALDALLEECGQTREGGCLLAGSEYCDFECPFRD